VISEVDESLRTLVKAEVVSGTDVDVVFDAPTREWASRRSKPTIDLYLYDIREDLRRRQTGYLEKRDDRGVVTERQQLPRYFKMAYLITAWTQRPEDEHRLLAAVLATFMKYDNVPDDYLTPLLAGAGLPVLLQIAYPLPEDRQVPDVWSSLGGDLKPSLELVATMAIQPDAFFEVAQAVMAPMRLRSSATTTLEADDGLRYLRNGPNGTDNGSSEEPAAQAASTKKSK
jgi:hypothetical protein